GWRTLKTIRLPEKCRILCHGHAIGNPSRVPVRGCGDGVSREGPGSELPSGIQPVNYGQVAIDVPSPPGQSVQEFQFVKDGSQVRTEQKMRSDLPRYGHPGLAYPPDGCMSRRSVQEFQR